jgi:hypothetical protein
MAGFIIFVVFLFILAGLCNDFSISTMNDPYPDDYHGDDCVFENKDEINKDINKEQELTMQKKKEKFDMKYVKSVVENEGFDYAMRDYSEFEEVDDEEFHRLRMQYIEAAKELENYIDPED